MSIQKISVPKNQVHKILQIEEGHFEDLKAIDISPAKLTKAISAFANADGGELYVGIEKDPMGKITVGADSITWKQPMDICKYSKIYSHSAGTFFTNSCNATDTPA